mmetsp:Transcript_14336/g.17553  ORF Transcript_14336/g.17553 Transcript_14336/m.17553 type:complete len:398 (-) Transcript_14336:407-1600(-)
MVSTTDPCSQSINAISLVPKLTQSLCERERKGRINNLKTASIRLGFHAQEVDQVFAASSEIEKLLLLSSEEDKGKADGENHCLRPLTIWNGELLKHLIAQVEESSSSQEDTALVPDKGAEREFEDEESSATAIMERKEEIEVLEAIYAEGFQLLSNTSSSSEEEETSSCTDDNVNLHYRVEVTPTQPLHLMTQNDTGTNANICHLHVLANRRGYPLSSPPMLWFTNSILPAALLRQINIQLQKKARELVGQASVFDLMEYVAEELATWQRQYMEEEGLTPHDQVERSDTEEYQYQRQKLRAAGKPYTHHDVLLEQQRITDETNKRRQEQVRFENKTMTSRLAGEFLNQQMNERVEEEVNAAGRKAMNDALCKGEGRDEARKAAEVAEKEVRKFHGLG